MLKLVLETCEVTPRFKGASMTSKAQISVLKMKRGFGGARKWTLGLKGQLFSMDKRFVVADLLLSRIKQ